MDIRDVAFISSEEDLRIIDAVAYATTSPDCEIVSYTNGTKISSLEPTRFINVILGHNKPSKPIKLKKKNGWGKKNLPEPNIKPKPETEAVWMTSLDQLNKEK